MTHGTRSPLAVAYSAYRVWRWRHAVLVIVVCGLWLVVHGEAQGQTATSGRLTQPSATVDWAAGLVRGQGKGVAPAGVPGPARRTAALSRALEAARQHLSMQLGTLRVNATQTVAEVLREDPQKHRALAELIAATEIVETRFLPQDQVETTVQLALFGPFTALLWPELAEPALPPTPAAGTIYTGVVVDARGLAIQPALFPRLLDENMQLLYAPSHVDATAAAQRGYIAYTSALESSQLEPRVGKQPLVVRARRITGTARVDLVISQPDAIQLQRSEALRQFLVQCRVVIVG